MAVITEHEEDQINPPGSPSKSKPKPKSKPKTKSKSEPAKPKSQHQPSSTPQKNQASNPFTFWFYFTIAVSLITLLFVSLSSLSPQDPKSWFLSLIHHPSDPLLDEPAIEVFIYSKGSKSSKNVLIVHGLGCSSFTFRKVVDDLASKGVFADLPGSGFSDKTVVKERDMLWVGVLGSFFDVKEHMKFAEAKL
ncbi:hypothetical protein Cgig2_027498 [Carnegiea gigantea]|uniref:Uncharacterized protein n=1 Tax=Carnegiea gigantea TaxID=171969 RepID=A0A9Q1QM30_9CARY|nr:hypothetical protein Cgig2_027498 [Carnegiea gigantea]